MKIKLLSTIILLTLRTFVFAQEYHIQNGVGGSRIVDHKDRLDYKSLPTLCVPMAKNQIRVM